MANPMFKYTDTNNSLPYINGQRPISATNRFDTRKSISFDPLVRPTLKYESQYSRQAFAEQSQMLDDMKISKYDTSKSMMHNSGPLIQSHTFDSSLKHIRPTPPTYPRNDYNLSQLRDMQLQLEQRDDRIWKLQSALDASRDTETEHLSTIQQLKRQLMFLETKDSINNSNSIINNLQQEIRDSQQRIADLESRLRTHMEERERVEQEKELIERKYLDVMNSLANLLFIDLSANNNSLDDVVNKITEVVQENTMMRGRHATVMDVVGNLETEQKTNRETIARLTSEIEKNQQFLSRSSIDVDNIRVERDTALSRQEDLLKELETLKLRLDSSHRAWSQMKAELEEARLNFNSSEAEKQRRTVADTLDGQRFLRFRENLSSLLTDGSTIVGPYEEQILTHVNKLMTTVTENANAINAMEKKLLDVSSELERQFEVSKAERNKQKQLQSLVEEMEEEARRRSSKDVIDQVINGRDQFVKHLNKIASALKMSPFKEPLPIDMITDEIVSCIDDLINRFSGNSDDDDTLRVHIVNLQRKVKSLKDQLIAKDNQLDEMIERIKEFEYKLSTMEIRDEDEMTRNKKLSKVLEKYKLELNEAHLELRQLRARLVEAADLKSDYVSKEEEIKKLKSKLKYIEQESSKHKQEITKLHQENQEITHVANELKSTKFSLEEMTRQHRQLFELRQLLAGMLGIPYNTSVAVDFEIISRLEKLIVAIHRDPEIMENIHIDPNNSVGLAEEFRRGYNSVMEQSRNSYNNRSRPEKSVRLQNVNMRGINNRPRSLSPRKKLDTKMY